MSTLPRHPAWRSLLLSLFATTTAAAQDPAWLGEAPRLELAPLDEPPPGDMAATDSAQTPQAVQFNPLDRNQVINAYRSIYLAQDAVDAGWTGNVAGCNAGTTSTAYRQATIDRVNFYRALAGLPGNVTLMGGTAGSAAQQAALMFSANGQLDHNPPQSWLCWTSSGAEGAWNANIAIGTRLGGPAAVALYMEERGTYNDIAGHRRWILYPPQASMDSGSVPQGSNASNALWVLGPFGTRPATPNGVAWPSRGYVPWPLLPAQSNRWSFSWPGADFSAAQVRMTRNGQALGAVAYERIATGYGDNTLVWRPQGVTYVRPAADVTYRVTISGLRGTNVPTTIQYDVIAIDPDVVVDPLFANGFER